MRTEMRRKATYTPQMVKREIKEKEEKMTG